MRYLIVGLMTIALAGCDQPEEPPKHPVAAAPAAAPAFAPLSMTAYKSKVSKPGCKAKACPSLEIDLERLTGDPAIDAQVESALASMILLGDKPVQYSGIKALAADFWARAESDWGIELQSRVLYQKGPLLVVQLDSYLYNGGAHGIPNTRYLNIDRAHGNRVLSLADMLVEGQESTFWELVKPLHSAWLKEMDSTDAEFAQTWPFSKTANVALLLDGIRVKYQVYEAGPFAFGQPEFFVTRDKLAPLLRSEFR
ncbi:MAG TPA: RsiV family protein [Fluviicoccus sp.]|nr:RsiV family protein [Fluviicoccus sp.]